MPYVGTRSLLTEAIRKAKPGRDAVRLLELLGEFEGWLKPSKATGKAKQAEKTGLSDLADTVAS